MSTPNDWHSQAYEWLVQGDYAAAANFYEQIIEQAPETPSYYWHFGLLLLLQRQEVEAQTVWLMGMGMVEPAQTELQTATLAEILQTEAARQEHSANLELAWLIRQHLRELVPAAVENLLHLVWLACQIQPLEPEELADFGVAALLTAQSVGTLPTELVLATLAAVLQTVKPHPAVVELTQASIRQVEDCAELLAVVLPAAVQMAHTKRQPTPAAQILAAYLDRDPGNVEVMGHLALFYQDAKDFERGLQVARDRLQASSTPVEQAHSSHLILRGLMTAGGYWQSAIATAQQHQARLAELTTADIYQAHPVQATRLYTAAYFLPYMKDDLRQNRAIQNHVSQLSQQGVLYHAQAVAERLPKRPQPGSVDRQRPLRIGYLSHCLGRHSVGHLAQWLIRHHDRDRVQLYSYMLYPRHNDYMFDWYRDQFYKTHVMGIDSPDNDSLQLAEVIYHDAIDILIDLDSITIDLNCEVLALKPAPIQATWLGWDASGMPAVDYFIADPYVLPDGAQDHYSEKIWRLPHTYIAVDGFEIGVPTLRRQDLDIPPDAVVYLSAQRGFKRHRDTTQLQMQILKQVPNSYFLIKGLGNEQSIQAFFIELATAAGVDSNRLRFLPEAPSEAVHRANLAIADIVLDTFPYNGATTTLETLWMGLPLVTQVGEQFASRNSYTMLINAGMTEGIAWSAEEYVEWGVRLGHDAALRQQIHWKLLRSRQTAPLWDGKTFAREVENAYEQMWQQYCELE